MLGKQIRNIDEILFSNSVQKKLIKLTLIARIIKAKKPFLSRAYSEYSENSFCKLSELFEKYGSDKGSISDAQKNYSWPSHTYAHLYSKLFWQNRESIKNVFECGLGSNNVQIPSNMGPRGIPGASLRAWRDFFPNAEIYGADIDLEIRISEDRIQTFYVDQLDSDSIIRLWKTLPEVKFDLMIDDGLHTFEAGSTLFINSVDRLEKNGIYVIEDVTESDLEKYKEFFVGKEYHVEFVRLFSANILIRGNNLILIRSF